MATNPTVEKLQGAAIRHGEKVVVALAVALFLFFVFKAVTKEPPIAFGPDALQKKAESADSNLSKPQPADQILAALVEAGVKPATEFEATVVKQQSKALDPADYLVKQRWVTPEPGAGLIRDQPELIAPEDLYAFPNRGGYQLFATDDKGERIEDTGKEAKKRPMRLGKKRRRPGGMMGGMSGGSAMSGSRPSAASSAKAKAEAEAKAKLEEDRLRKSVAGDISKAKADEKSDAEPTATVAYKEVVKGLRSVVVTGTLDNKKLRDNYLAALKNSTVAYPNYKRLDVERQARNPDGSWGEFQAVDSDANFKVLDNLTEIDDELVPEDARLEALVDPLPFPKAGYWTGVHVASLVPKGKLEVKRPEVSTALGSGGMSGDYMAQMQRMQQMQQQQQMPGGGSSSMGSAQMQMQMQRMAAMGGPGGMMGGPGGPGAAGPGDDMDFPKSEADQVMIRSLDFTVQPDETYRYRARIVVVNPNLSRTDVAPGVDTTAEELTGPWSEPTDAVTVPADVATYAMTKAAVSRRRDQVKFMVVRWNPADGQTVTRDDEAGPGELIGQQADAQVPSTEGKGATRTSIDFNSHQVVVDTMGGLMPAPKSIGATAPFDEPTLALVLRPDGAVALHAQPRDVTDPVRAETHASYVRAIKESTKKRKPRNAGMSSPSMSMPGSKR